MITYRNPVYDGYFADPFVLRHDGAYWAYGTGHGPERDGRWLPILRSADLSNWSYVGGALTPGRGDAGPFDAYWAPEVAQRDGRFYLHYSAATGGDENHRLRVAISDDPAGPFEDAGRLRLPDPYPDVFCIDAHPFRDPKDGRWYLFFASDFFEGRVGTGTVAVPLGDDMTSASGPAVTVLRATSDWHIYQRDRHHYGRTWDAWHTVEGPFVWPHAGRYYCFYSGGNWQTQTYGVGYGIADNVLGPYRDEWNREGPSVLRGIENLVLGPGHNSIVLGPDDQTEFVIYHAWDANRTARRMFIDPLLWIDDPRDGLPKPRCDGPTTDLRSLRLERL